MRKSRRKGSAAPGVESRAGGCDLAPSLVYGPASSRAWTVNVAKRLLSGAWGCFDQFGEGIANLVYVDDLVRAILLALAGPACTARRST